MKYFSCIAPIAALLLSACGSDDSPLGVSGVYTLSAEPSIKNCVRSLRDMDGQEVDALDTRYQVDQIGSNVRITEVDENGFRVNGNLVFDGSLGDLDSSFLLSVTSPTQVTTRDTWILDGEFNASGWSGRLVSRQTELFGVNAGGCSFTHNFTGNRL